MRTGRSGLAFLIGLGLALLAPAVLAIAGVYERSAKKYGQRATACR